MRSRGDVEYAKQQALLAHKGAEDDNERKFHAGKLAFCDWFLSGKESPTGGMDDGDDALQYGDCRG